MLSGRDPNCKLCKLSKTAEFVCLLGAGDKRAEIMIIGEAPGQREDASGVPFVGKSGQILDEVLEEVGLDRDDIYITNAVHCRPPDNRTPSKAEIRSCKKWLDYEIARVNPKYIVLLGNVPLQAVMGITGIKKQRGKPVEQDGRIIIPTFHPSFALRDPTQLYFIKRDFAKLVECVEFGGIPEERDLDYTVVDTMDKVEEMIDDLYGCVSCDLETTRLYPFTTELDEKVRRKIATDAEVKDHKATHNGNQPQVVSIQFGTGRKQWIMPAEQPGIFSKEQLIEIVDRLTEKLEDCYLVGHNAKFDSLWMRVRFGVAWVFDFDTMLAHYVLDENDLHGLKELAQKYLGAPDWDVGGDVKTSWSLKNAKYGAHDVYYTRKLRFYLGKKLVQDTEVKRVFDKIMMPCVELFTEAEFDGIYIDQSKMDDAEMYLRGEVAYAEKTLDKWAHPDWAVKDKKTGMPTINWGSPQQLGKLLYEDLGLEGIEKTKSGKAWSTSESVLLRTDHKMVGSLLRWRAAQKQLSGFIEGWRPYIDLNGYLHPSFKLHGTVTGRLSCEHPNLQQVPRDKRIRTLITADDGWELIEADLSQIELRIAAELANEHNMLIAFATGVDVHWLTAIREIERGAGYKSEIISTATRHSGAGEGNRLKKMGYSEAVEYILSIGPDAATEIDEMWKEVRKKAKAINFGYLYGMWWKKFKLYARDNYQVDVTDEEAQQSRKAFFFLYPEFLKWHERQRRFARLHGYVRSLSGRKRRLPDATSSRDTPQRREAERQAINSPVQSFANELNLMAALQIRREFGRNVVKLCGTVHDACLMRVRKDMVPTVYRRVLEIMSKPSLLSEFDIVLNVPIEAEAKIGPWGAGVRLDKWLEAEKLAA